jgi:3-oxoacyl-[acyl-carrier-protein] synthase-1
MCIRDRSEDRLLGSHNANGFIPGEAAAALLVGAASGGPEFVCTGLGLGEEPMPCNNAGVLGLGLAGAIQAALGEAGLGMHELDFRISDAAGEQRSFREAALAMLRTMRQRRESCELWHPAESVGAVGAAGGLVSVVVAKQAIEAGYAPGRSVLVHCENETGMRAALVFRGGLDE